MMGQQNIASNRRKDSAANRLGEMIAGGVGRCGSDQAAQSEGRIQLLCVNSLAYQEAHAKEDDTSQILYQGILSCFLKIMRKFRCRFSTIRVADTDS